MGDCFYLGSLFQSSGVLPSMVYTTVKNKPLTEQKAWERGSPGNFARGWGRWKRRRNLYPETLGRVLFHKSYVDSKGLRTRGILSLTAPSQRVTQCVSRFWSAWDINKLPLFMGSPRIGSAIFQS